VVSKRGFFSANIGPDADGVIPQPAVDRLHAIGDWLRVNGESIVSFRLACVRGGADLFLRGIRCQDAAYRGASDLELTGDLGFADAGTM